MLPRRPHPLHHHYVQPCAAAGAPVSFPSTSLLTSSGDGIPEPLDVPYSDLYSSAVVGKPYPLGSSVDPATGGVNFALQASGACLVTLVLFQEDDLGAGKATCEVPLSPDINRTGIVWHICLLDLDPNVLYGYRVHGQHEKHDPEAPGHRHDPN